MHASLGIAGSPAPLCRRPKSGKSADSTGTVDKPVQNSPQRVLQASKAIVSSLLHRFRAFSFLLKNGTHFGPIGIGL